jgi:hypothetical protein
MERINRIGADKYTIEVNDSGEILLKTGSGGKVKVTGDLEVLGATTTVESTEVAIGDKTFTLNKNDAGGDGGITDLGDGYDRQAGIIVYRGNDRFDARIFYDEELDTIRAGARQTSTEGAFVFKTGSGEYSGIHTSSIITEDNQDLYLIGHGTGVVSVFDSTDYQRQVWLYNGATTDINFLAGPINSGKADTLINAQGVVEYVDSYHDNFFQYKIEKDTVTVDNPSGTPSRVEIFDADIDGGTSRVEIAVDESVFSTFYDTRVEFGTLRFLQDPADVGVITSNSIDTNIRLRGNGLGQVQIDGWQNFMLESDPADPPAEGVTIYSKTLGDGGTGLFFKNQDGTTDEFVSRNKALLYSIIF